jgi:hypothetical protein
VSTIQSAPGLATPATIIIVPILFTYSGISTPGTPITAISEVCPAGKLWKVLEALVVSRAYSSFSVNRDALAIGAGKNGPASENVTFTWKPYASVAEGETIEVVYTQIIGPAVDIDIFLFISQEDA